MYGKNALWVSVDHVTIAEFANTESDQYAKIDSWINRLYVAALNVFTGVAVDVLRAEV